MPSLSLSLGLGLGLGLGLSLGLGLGLGLGPIPSLRVGSFVRVRVNTPASGFRPELQSPG